MRGIACITYKMVNIQYNVHVTVAFILYVIIRVFISVLYYVLCCIAYHVILYYITLHYIMLYCTAC